MKLSDFDNIRAAIDARSDLQEDLKFISENAFWMDMKIGQYEFKSLGCFEPQDRKSVFDLLQKIILGHLDSSAKELIQLGIDVDD